MHLRLVLPGHTQHVHHVSVRCRSASLPSIHHGRHLHPLHASFRHRNLNVIRHGLGTHEHPRLLSHDMQNPHKWLIAPFYNGDNLPAAPLCLTGALLRHGHFHGIPMQRPARLGGFYINVLLLSVNAHKDKALSGHYCCSDILGHPLRRFLLLVVLVLAF